MFEIQKRKIRVEEYQELRGTTNWDMFASKTVEKALSNDLFSICILDNDKTIGIGRVIGDDAIYYYIQDVIVLQEYRGKGVGDLIMKEIESYLISNTVSNAFIGLMAADGAKDFYAKYSYLDRPKNAPGMSKKMG